MGALTIKPYSFTYRPWELEKIILPNLFSIFPETITLHLKNTQKIRVVPSKNTEFITNTVRFLITKSQKMEQKSNLNWSLLYNCLNILLTLFTNTNITNKLLVYLFFFNMLMLHKVKILFKKNNNIEFNQINFNAFLNTLGKLNNNFGSNIVPLTLRNVTLKGILSSDVYMITTQNLREYAVDFLMQLKPGSNTIYKIIILYISKIKKIFFSKNLKLEERQVRLVAKNLIFFYLPLFFKELNTFILEIPLLNTVNFTILWYTGKIQNQTLGVEYVTSSFNQHNTSFYLNIFKQPIQINNAFCVNINSVLSFTTICDDRNSKNIKSNV